MRILLLNQAFYPDVVSTAQHLSDLATALAERGHEVTVVAGRRAYDEPEKLFPSGETWRGVRIRRIYSTRFGKSAKWRRAADFASFIFFCCARLLFLRRHDVVVALTTPPLISFIGAWRAKLWRAKFCYWVMDMNPDEAIAAGWLRRDSFAGKMLERMSRFSFRRADRIVALDRFMRDRIAAKGIAPEKILVIPPWSLDDEVKFDAAGRERFRAEHGLRDKFVVMYAGNHSPVHPLDTLMQAAELLKDDRSIAFCFVGGGSEFKRVKQWAEGAERKAQSAERRPRTTDHGLRTADGLRTEDSGLRTEDSGLRTAELSTLNSPLSTVLCLPYQPLNQLSASLSAADAQVVVMGNEFVGLVHPCKIYNILAVSAPVVYIGPRPGHVTEILDGLDGHPQACVQHGEAQALAGHIRHLAAAAGNRQALPPKATVAFSKAALLPRFIAALEELK